MIFKISKSSLLRKSKKARFILYVYYFIGYSLNHHRAIFYHILLQRIVRFEKITHSNMLYSRTYTEFINDRMR